MTLRLLFKTVLNTRIKYEYQLEKVRKVQWERTTLETFANPKANPKRGPVR